VIESSDLGLRESRSRTMAYEQPLSHKMGLLYSAIGRSRGDGRQDHPRLSQGCFPGILQGRCGWREPGLLVRRFERRDDGHRRPELENPRHQRGNAGWTEAPLSKIFSGATTDWSAAGGGTGAIHLYRRDDKSGTFDTFKSLVLGTANLASSAKRFEDSSALPDAVANDANGIHRPALCEECESDRLAETGAMPMLPNRFTVATEDYPLSRRLYLYTPATPQNKYTREFVQFAISKAGQDIVGSNAFVAQNVVGQRETVSASAPAEYRRLINGAERLSVDFRFRTGRADLDNKAIVDLDRVIGFVSDLHYSGDNVLRFGFADSTGGRQMNQALSENRAKTVAQQFEQRGLHPGTVKGCGQDLPVASNDTEDGREKNRRVEIWVRK
jgi:phosphate transport system substrate-binding protein